MLKKDKDETFFDENFSTPPKRNYPTVKIIYIHIDEVWSLDLVDMIDYRISNNKGFRYIFIIIDNFSKYVWAIPRKIKIVKQYQKNFQVF